MVNSFNKQKFWIIILVSVLLPNFIFLKRSYAVDSEPVTDAITSDKEDSTPLLVAQKKQKKITRRSRDTGQFAKVANDGAAVYQFANFDSPVMEYLDVGKKIKISKKIYKGIGGLGTFYKIRLQAGGLGYIVDTDVELLSAQSKSSTEQQEKNINNEPADPLKVQDSMFNDSEDEGDSQSNSLFLNKYWGVSYYSFNYAETISNVVETTTVPMYGLKRTGPTSFMGGIPFDINAVFSFEAPDFYNKFSKASGFMFIGDALILLPFYESNKWLVSYGFGPVVRFSKWSVKIKNSNLAAKDSQELGFGAALTLGVAADIGALLRIKRGIILRADSRYYYEKEKYLGLGASLQFKF